MHANGNIVQRGAGIIDGDVSAVGTVSVGAAVSGRETASAEGIEVPLITAADFNAWRTKALIAPNIFSATDYTYSDSGDQSYRMVFVDGNIDVPGSALQNVTIIATGNLTVTGSAKMNGDGSIGTAMIAGGNILFMAAVTLTAPSGVMEILGRMDRACWRDPLWPEETSYGTAPSLLSSTVRLRMTTCPPAMNAKSWPGRTPIPSGFGSAGEKIIFFRWLQCYSRHHSGRRPWLWAMTSFSSLERPFCSETSLAHCLFFSALSPCCLA
jgi:hypothetical protein